jgi:sugar/nucleoside kinase (ribokinase family)
MKVICIGSSSKDIFFPTGEGKISETPEDLMSQKKITFELGAKYQIEDRYESLGGCAANQACGLSRLGVSALCYTVLGNDSTGSWIMQEVEKEGVDAGLATFEDCPSGLSAIIVDEKSGERVIFSNQEANERMQIEKEKLADARWISVSDPNGNWRKNLDDVFETAQISGVKVMFNPRGKNIQEDAKKVYELAGKSEIFFVNKDEAIEIISNNNAQMKADDLNNGEFLIKELKKSGAKIAVITDGKNGAWTCDGKCLIYAPALGNEPVETTGAGDAFSSGFIAAYVKGKNPEDCLKWGIANSGNAVNFYGGVEGLLTEEQILKKIKDINVSKIAM